jgi:NADPH-dependent glutamate synthase beta subunit-like oxidoreductase
VVVVGGGNVAYDVARTIVRQVSYDAARTVIRLAGTGRVTLTSLETLEEMPADTLEILEGDEEGVVRMNGWGPTQIHRNESGYVTGVEFRRCLQVYDAARKFAPVFDDQDRRVIPCDSVVLAVGQAPNLSFLADGGEDVEQFRPGWPKVDPQTLASTARGIFVAGDLAHGTRLLIDAVASGKKAARSVYEFITGRAIRADALVSHIRLDRYRREAGYEAIRRVPTPVAEAEHRIDELDREVELGYDCAAAMREASRCLDCGATPVFDGSRCVLCGGCADVCPTECLKLVPLSELAANEELDALVDAEFGAAADLELNSAILKDEDRCIRCALCVERCPTAAIAMERVTACTTWSCV